VCSSDLTAKEFPTYQLDGGVLFQPISRKKVKITLTQDTPEAPSSDLLTAYRQYSHEVVGIGGRGPRPLPIEFNLINYKDLPDLPSADVIRVETVFSALSIHHNNIWIYYKWSDRHNKYVSDIPYNFEQYQMYDAQLIDLIAWTNQIIPQWIAAHPVEIQLAEEYERMNELFTAYRTYQRELLKLSAYERDVVDALQRWLEK